MIRFLTLVLASASLMAVSCAQMKKSDSCSACCGDKAGKAKPAAAACCSSDKPHKH